MSYRVRAVATPALATGLRLAGIPTDEAASPGSAAERVAAMAGDPELGILIVEEPLYDEFTSAFRHELEARALPIIVPMPRPAWGRTADRAEAYILELLRRAIGYRVRLQ